jgi:hypothetical protein
MKRLLIISALILTAAWQTISQTSVDALRYSRIDIGGTARYMGLSGAFGALGADFTTASTNPAGIGMYKSSEFTITPSVHIGAINSTYNGTQLNDNRSNFYLGDIGMVMTAKVKSDPKKPGFRTFTFATGLNRLNDFNYRADMEGYNDNNSFLDTYVESANGIPFSEIEDDAYGDYAYDLNLAWWTYLLDLYNPNINNLYTSPVPSQSLKYQSKYVDTHGSMNEYVFSFGTNYNDRLYLGMTFAIPFIRYYEYSVYEESLITDSDLKNFQKIDNLETRGSGFNMKFGLIYRVSDWFRLGASIHTPSWFGNMNDYWVTTMTSSFYTPDNDGNYSYVETSPSGNYNYNLRTPFRAQGSMAFIIGNVGLVSAEYEYVDYANAQLDAPDYNFSQENTAIQNSYTGGNNIRIGTEWRYNIFSFRAGGKYFTSPYQNNINDASEWGFSAGLGLRQKWFFMDLTYSYTQSNQDYYFYKTSDINPGPVNNKISSNCILITTGVKL